MWTMTMNVQYWIVEAGQPVKKNWGATVEAASYEAGQAALDAKFVEEIGETLMIRSVQIYVK